MRSLRPRGRRAVRRLAAAALLVAAAASAAPRAKSAVVSPDVRVVLEAGDEIVLLGRVLPRESLDGFAKRFGGDASAKKAVRAANGGLPRWKPGHWVRVPYRILSATWRQAAIRGLFPADHATPAGWEHRVAALSGRPESLWMIAEWFTGDGSRYKAIREADGIASLETREGQVVTVPERLLAPPFRDAVAAAVAAAVPASPADTEVPKLEYGEDAQGRYAIYRLKKGEALYSAVVVRFTGRLHAEDVNAKAAEIAARNGIADVHAMPVGYPVRIPIEDLSPEFRPPGDPERVAEEKTRLEAAQFANKVRSADLSGVTLVLDAGHGGRDTGALVEGLEEAAYVYDISCRVDRLVRANTRARVVPTVGRDAPCGAAGAEAVASTRSARVLTTPPYAIEDAAAGVHFRWYLANSVYKNVRQYGGHEDRTVFISLHADSLHPAVRGTMVYVPGEKFLSGSYGKAGEPYDSRREVKEARMVSFSGKEKVEAEGISRDLAEHIVTAFRAADLPLHAFEPVRGNVIRGGREWVPAILRYNRIPARVLVEVCNLNNPDDRRLLRTRGYRERVAEALVQALVSFYGGAGGEGAGLSAASAGTRR
jgi:N-acetylmuramoyl-L-alanine amidase